MTALPLYIPSPLAVPAPAPVPLSAAATNPYFGLNPYASSTGIMGAPVPSGISDPRAAALVGGATGIPTTGSSGFVDLLGSVTPPANAAASDAEAAAAQVQTGIAKLATANPELAARLQEQFTSGGTSSGGGGGFFGGLIHLGGEILGGAGKVLDIVGRTAHLVPALVDEAIGQGEESNPFATIGAVMTGHDQTNWNAVMQDAGMTGGGVFGVLRAGIGFALDVATDPLTYAFSPGAIVGQGEKAAGAAKLLATRSEPMLELAARAGVVGDAAGTVGEKMTTLYDGIWKGIKPGLAQNADAVIRAETEVGKVAGVGIEQAQRDLAREMVDLSAHVFDSVETRTFKQWLKTGYKTASGMEVSPTQVRKVLEDAVKAGAGQAHDARDVWNFAKQASGALGGVRMKALVPWTRLRYISPALPFTDRISLGAVGRFAAGFSGAKQLTSLIQDGKVGYEAMRAFMEQPWHTVGKTLGFVETHPDVAALMTGNHFTGISSMFYAASDQVGRLTAAVTPGAKQFRLGLGHYMYEAQLKTVRAGMNDLMHQVMHDQRGTVTEKSGTPSLFQMAKDTLGLDIREGKKSGIKAVPEEDMMRMSTWMESFAGTSAPINGTEAELRGWFDATKDSAYHLGRAAADDPEAVAADAAREAVIWKDMLEAHQWALAKPGRADTMDAFAQAQKHARQVLQERGADIGNATNDLATAHIVHPEDVPPGAKRMWYVPEDQTIHMRTNDFGMGSHNVVSHDLDAQGHLSGVMLHETDPGGGVSVMVDAGGRVLELNPDFAARSDLLGKMVEDQRIYAENVAAIEDFNTALVAPIAEQNPRLLAGSADAAKNTADRAGQLLNKALSNPEGGHFSMVSLGDGRSVLLDPNAAKLISEGAARTGERGFNHRTFTTELSTFLTGQTSTGRISVTEVRSAEFSAQRKFRHSTLAEAEVEIRKLIRARLAENGAKADVLAKLDTIPIFEHNILKSHSSYEAMVGSTYFAVAEGKIQARMLGISRMSPLMLGRLADQSVVKYEVPKEFLRLLKGATKEQQRTLLDLMSKQSRWGDLMVKDQVDGVDMVHALVAAVEDGVDPEHLIASAKVQRYLDASTKFNDILAAEQEANARKTARLAADAQLRSDALAAMKDIQLAPTEARLLQEETLQAQLAPIQEEARAIMARGGAVDVPADLRAAGGRATERLDYTVAPLTPDQLGRVDSAQLAEQASEPGGGFTVNVATGKQPTKGFSVAVAGHETPVEAGAGLGQAIEDFKKAHAEELAQPGTHLGGWHDDIPDSPTFGKVVLDISHVEPTQAAAERFGRENGQTAIYDLAKGETIDIRAAAENLSPDMTRLRELSAEKDRIIAAHEQAILDAPIADPAESKAVKEIDALIDSKVTVMPSEMGGDIGVDSTGEKFGLTPKQVEREQAGFERAKAHGHAEELEPDVWAIRPGPSHKSFSEGNMVGMTKYVKLGEDGRVVSVRTVSSNGHVIAESVRGLPHIADVAPGRTLGRAHWADQGIDSLAKAREAVAKQNFSVEGGRLNKLLVRDLVRGLPDTTAPTARQIVDALDAGELRVLVKDGKTSILTRDGALRAGGKKVRTLEDIRSDYADITAAKTELDALAAGGQEAFDAARTTRAARALDAQDGRLSVLSTEAKRVGKKVEKLSYADGKRVGKMGVKLSEAYTELNRATAKLDGIGAQLKPAMSFTSDVGGHEGMVPLAVDGLQGAWAHPYIAEEINFMLGGKSPHALQEAWRSHVLGPWKRWATYRNPGFHVRNFFGAWFNGFLGGVNAADEHFSVRLNMARGGHKYMDVPLAVEEFDRLALNLVPGFRPLRGKLTYGQLGDMLSEEGIGRANVTTIAFADDVGRKLTSGEHGPIRNAVHRTLQSYDHYGRLAGSSVEDFHRVATWAAGMRTTQGDMYGARTFVMARHGDYEDLTAAEQNIKDIIPFYKWMRTNTPYQIRMLAENPGLLTLPLKLQRSIADAEGLDWEKYQQARPQWLKNTFAIPLPGGGSLLEDLPYSDLYQGFNDYLSRMLPVGGKFIESYGFKKNLFTGQALEGKMVPLSGPLGQVANLPLFKQAIQALPFFQAGADGQTYVNDQIENTLQVFPLYARFRNWTTGDPDRAPARWSTLAGWLTGSKVIPPDLTSQEKAFYYDVIAPTIATYQSMGYVLPTKTEMDAATAALQAPPSFDFPAAYPTGAVA